MSLIVNCGGLLSTALDWAMDAARALVWNLGKVSTHCWQRIPTSQRERELRLCCPRKQACFASCTFDLIIELQMLSMASRATTRELFADASKISMALDCVRGGHKQSFAKT